MTEREAVDILKKFRNCRRIITGVSECPYIRCAECPYNYNDQEMDTASGVLINAFYKREEIVKYREAGDIDCIITGLKEIEDEDSVSFVRRNRLETAVRILEDLKE